MKKLILKVNRLLIIALLMFSVKGWAQYADTTFIITSSGHSLMCIHNWPIDAGPGSYHLRGDNSLSGHLIIPWQVILPENVGGQIVYRTHTIDDFLFKNCTNLTAVTVSEGYSSLKPESFMGCTGLVSVQLPSTLRTIGARSFKDCISLPSVNIPDSVGEIGIWAFGNCCSLDSIVLPERLGIVKCGIFENCTSLVSVSIPSTVGEIEPAAFSGCTSLASIVLPDSLRVIGEYGFYGPLPGIDPTNPDAGAFSNCSSLMSITIPSKVRVIGDYTFSGCSNLSTVVFPDSTERFGHLAFNRCSLTTLNIPNSVKELGYGVFSKCTSLEEVTIPRDMRHIGWFTFDSCVSMTTVNFNADSIYGGGGDDYCWPHGATTYCMDGKLWGNCPNFTTLNIGNNVKWLKEYLFLGATSLVEVTIPTLVQHMSRTFELCTGLTTVNYNARNAAYAVGPFYGCTSLTYVNFGDSVEVIPISFLSGITTLNEIELPESVHKIGGDAFRGCTTGQSKLIIPDAVDTIGETAFQSCDFDTLVLGSSLNYIAHSSFSDIALNAVIARMQDPSAIRYSGISWVWNTDLYVPCGTRELYRHAAGWSGFRNVIDPQMLFSVNADSHGVVEILLIPTCDNDTAIFYAIADSFYTFSHWSDGETSNPRTLVLTQDTSITAYFDKICDSFLVASPYESDFTDCWITTGNAYIDSIRGGIVPAVGDTLFSPWIDIDSNTFVAVSYDQVDSTLPFSYIYIDVISQSGQLLSHNSMMTIDNGLRLNLGNYSGQVARIAIYHKAVGNSASIAVTRLSVYSYRMRATVEGPDTVYVGDTVTFSMNVEQQDNRPLSYVWNASGDVSYYGSRNENACSIVWNSPGNNNGIYYYVSTNYNGESPYVQGTKLIIVLLRPETCNIAKSPVPFSVRPTVMDRGQEIVVELDEGANAREIDVVNALGQTVKRVPISAGQREVRINSVDLGSGMNFINTRTADGHATVKIIVR